jgi:diketogulonate reductase-like aldo/keto reductase
MRAREFGWTGEQVPVIGQGTWKMEQDDPGRAVEALRRGLDLGLRHVDTAEAYGSGKVEELVGEAIRGRRDEVFLASKVKPSNASYQGTLRACERSLKRLGTDHLDLYLLHWPGTHPLEDTLRAFEALVDAGKIRFWGLSNFDVGELDQAVSIVGEERIACNQVLHHLRARQVENLLLPWCERHRVALVGYSPFGSGNFPSPRSVDGRVLAQIALRHQATPYQVALRFLTRAEQEFAIPKAASAEHAEQNAAATELVLTGDERRQLEGAFPLPEDATLPMI